MTEVNVSIELLSYWQAGSGEGVRPFLDAVSRRDQDGLPYLPGKTIKGIWREAMRATEDYRHVPEHTTDLLFGQRSEDPGPGDFESGILAFSNAVLPDSLRNWFLNSGEGRDCRRQLFHQLDATALQDGLAVDKSLRSIEVCVPLTLHARVSLARPVPRNFGDPSWRERLSTAAGLIRKIGYQRHRGLGRCRFQLDKTDCKE